MLEIHYKINPYDKNASPLPTKTDHSPLLEPSRLTSLLPLGRSVEKELNDVIQAATRATPQAASDPTHVPFGVDSRFSYRHGLDQRARRLVEEADT